MKLNVHVTISGRVQGVWFRANTKQKAEQLNVTGWVRNKKNGDVEAVFEGEEKHIKEMIEWCHNGPPLAKVEKVETKNQDPANNLDSFKIKY